MSKNPSPNTVSQKGSDFKDHFRYLMASRWARGNIVVGMQLGAADMIICHPFPPCRTPLFHGSDGPPPRDRGEPLLFHPRRPLVFAEGGSRERRASSFSFLPLHLLISRGRELWKGEKRESTCTRGKSPIPYSPFSPSLSKKWI